MAIEAALPFGWERWIGDRDGFLGMSGYGASDRAEALYEHFGITAERAIALGAQLVAKT